MPLPEATIIYCLPNALSGTVHTEQDVVVNNIVLTYIVHSSRHLRPASTHHALRDWTKTTLEDARGWGSADPMPLGLALLDLDLALAVSA